MELKLAYVTRRPWRGGKRDEDCISDFLVPEEDRIAGVGDLRVVTKYDVRCFDCEGFTSIDRDR